MNKRQVTIAPSKKSIYIHSSHQRIRLISTEDRPIPKDLRLKRIGATAYYTYIRRSRNDKTVQIFAASLQDIEKALAPKKKVDVMSYLPKAHQHMAWIFDPKTAAKMPPLRGPEIDHRIELEKDENGKEKEPPWGPLYNMSRGELLVLRKELISLLDKGWIRASSSPARLANQSISWQHCFNMLFQCQFNWPTAADISNRNSTQLYPQLIDNKLR